MAQDLASEIKRTKHLQNAPATVDADDDMIIDGGDITNPIVL